MVSQNVNKIYRAVEALSEAERAELRHLLDTRAQRHAPASSATPAQELHAAEAEAERRKNRRRDFQPIDLPGGPLSDDIIRDRR
jgi:hypothetical protein